MTSAKTIPSTVLRQTDQLDKNGVVVKTTSIEREIFFVNGRRIARLVKRDGKDLTPAEDKAEQARVQKVVETVLKAAALLDAEAVRPPERARARSVTSWPWSRSPIPAESNSTAGPRSPTTSPETPALVPTIWNRAAEEDVRDPLVR